jgi:hypothetical protein
MNNFTLKKDIHTVGGNYRVEFTISDTLRDAIVNAPNWMMPVGILNSIGDGLTESRIPEENEVPFHAEQTASWGVYAQKWLSNRIRVSLMKLQQHVLVIEHVESNYNQERFRSRIDSVKRVFLEAAGIPVPPAGAGKKRKTRKSKKSLRRRRRTTRK